MATKTKVTKDELVNAAKDLNKTLSLDPQLDLESVGLQKEIEVLIPELTDGDDLAITTWVTLKKLGFKSETAKDAKSVMVKGKDDGEKTVKAPKAEKIVKDPKAVKIVVKVGKFSDEQKIEVLAKENPKREGSASAKRFDLYKKGMSVTKAKEAGLTMLDLSYDAAHGFIKIA